MKLLSTVSAKLLLAATLCASSLTALAQEPKKPDNLIKSITAPQRLGGNDNSEFAPSNLLDEKVGTKYHTWDETHSNFSGEQYLEVTLTDALNLGSNEDIIVYIQRCNDCDNRQPTVFKVMGSVSDMGDSDWEEFCRVYFLYRGKSTKEYSARIHTEKNFKRLRFYVIDNNTRSYDKDGHHSMGLAELAIYKLTRGEDYPYPMADQFHRRDDYKRDYENYEFVKTKGWLDPINRSLEKTSANQPDHYEHWLLKPEEYVNNEAMEKGTKEKQEENINKLRAWAQWDTDWDLATGEWNMDTDKLLELGVEMPSLAPITNDPDFDPAAKMQCQPTHVTEHVLYALPGDPIVLIPYGNFAEAKHFEKYEVNFAHWYDYRTGGRLLVEDEKTGVKTDLLDFLADPWGVCTSENDGFFGAYLLSEKKKNPTDVKPYIPNTLQAQNYGMSATFFCPRDPFIANGEARSLPFRKIDQALTTNLEEEPEFVIAADFSQSFNKGRNLVTNPDGTGKIIEPNIAFRHIFRIRDGKTLADALSGSEENNEAYLKRNRRDITARANKPFQIGLDISVPKPWNWVSDGKTYWRSVPSEYYHKVSDSDYRRITAMRIRVKDADGNTKYDLSNEASRDPNSIFYFGESFQGLGSRKDDDGITYYLSGRRIRTWGADNHDEEGDYYRMLKSDKTEDLNGKYTVEIIGQEIIGETELRDIKICGSSKELVIMQFDIDFVANETSANPKAILVSSDDLHSKDQYKSFRETEMVKKYGQAKDRIDFDYYRGLESLSTWKEYLDNRVEGSKHYQFRWPAAWSKSQYANGYSNAHNYNMYVVANHSSRTQCHNVFHEGFQNSKHDDEEKGLYDRLSDKTTRLNKVDASVEVQNGYFLYVNAASDPGVMATLKVDNLCTGSTVHVSAYVAEFSKQFEEYGKLVVTEKANIVFNFVAVLANGDRVNLHSFVSGYVDDNQAGEWMNISYSFNPDVTRFNSGMVDHYELELENNCKSSDGADYAIDDISIYIVSPVVSAEQKSPLCTDVANGQENIVKISTPFVETLQSIDVTEASGKNLTLQYVILDRQKFDDAYEEAYKAGNENPGLAAYNAEGVKVGEGIGENAIMFSSNSTSISPYTDDIALNTAAIDTDEERGVKMLAFNTNFTDDTFKVGKEYYISLYVTEATSETAAAGWTEFDIKDGCSKFCIFKVKSQNNIRVDGEIREQDGEISVCEGEAPVITVDIYTEDGTEVEDKHCDWFLGTRDEYQNMTNGELEFYKAYNQFRAVHPTAASPNKVEAQGDFTEEMRQYLIDNEDKLINFYKESYQFPALMIPEGEETAEDVVLVLPIPAPEEEGVTVCTAPMEIHIYADMHSPKVLHGLRSGITYPADMGNAPLRIGLEQLAQVRIENDATELTGLPMLVVPIRSVEISGEVKNVKAMAKDTDVLILESTTDPNYDLSTETVVSKSGEVYNILLEYEAGKISSFKAQIDGKENALGAVFYDNFTFREGYEYTFGYKFKEVVSEADKGTKLCDGRTRFKVKVVPEYLVWTPREDSRNWNNDGNWKRVSSTDLSAELSDKDLYVDDEDAVVRGRLNDKVTDGSNAKVGAYMPMNFTKVIIPAKDATNATVSAPFMYDWNGTDETAKAPAGAATENIQYDMVAEAGESNVECIQWYDNTCKEIHFLPNASIMNQQYLKYEKAWVDLELTPSRWYTLAMPLKKVFAGEFYLPTGSARQKTELFQPITYDEDLNDRFNPAVFQRGWDKGTADIYHTDGSTSTAVVSANWSHVYNDVQESYGSGVGFSIKADVSRVAPAPDKVLFRLPKADTKFDYYDADGFKHGVYKDINHKIDNVDVHYKLNEARGSITATTAGSEGGKYFLVGNPFMTYLDMEAFLEANSGKVAQKYWMITEGTQKTAVFDTNGAISGNAIGYVAPMQGFFVEATEENVGNTLTLEYDESMMADATSSTTPLKIASRSYDEGFTLTISALNDGEESTAAVVKVSPETSSDYLAEEDMVVIDNSDLEVRATVYTVGDGKALAVNSLDAIGNVELGLIALPREETILQFNMDGEYALNLYDAETGAYTPIFDGMTYPVSGNAAGRLYLTSACGVQTLEASSISWSAEGDELKVWSSDSLCSRLSVRVYDYAGRIVAAQSVDGCEVRLAIGSGVYVLEAETESERICLQVKL